MNSPLRVGTGSARLAVLQARRMLERLVQAGVPARLVEVSGSDEAALFEDQIDLSVAPLDAVAPHLSPRLTIAAIEGRQDPRDAWLGRDSLAWASIPSNARIAAIGLSRRGQLLRARPDLEIVELPGGIEALLAGLDADPELFGVIVPVAALELLGLTHRIGDYLPPELLIPAPGQGALVAIARAADTELVTTVREILHQERAAACVLAEWGFLGGLTEGREVPVAAAAVWAEPGTTADGWLELIGRVVSLDGQLMIEGVIAEPVHGELEAAQLGVRLAEDLVEQGARELLPES